MKNLVILISGSGTNLQRIIDCISNGEIRNAKVNLVIADRECFGLERAEKHNIRTQLIKRGKDFSENLENAIPENTDLIVLAGFLSILKPEFCQKWEGKMINIHPALLPKFGGKGMWGHHVHNAVIEADEKESGATVHFVTSGIDEGEIILQRKFEIDDEETLETLEKKIHLVEQDIFPKAIDFVLNGYSLNLLFEKVFFVFYNEHYFGKEESSFCLLHKNFKNGHNCVACNLNRQNELLFDFLESYDEFKHPYLTFNVFIWLLYLQIESIYVYCDILKIDKGKYFKTFRIIKDWANFLKHPKSFMLVHHPIFGFYETDLLNESIIAFDNEVQIEENEFQFINTDFVKDFYKNKNSDIQLKNILKNNQKVIVVFPNPVKLITDFVSEQEKFISLINANDDYKNLLDNESTLINYFENEHTSH